MPRPTEVAAKALEDLVRPHLADAIGTLVDVMLNGESEAAGVSAADKLLDRGYGRPTQRSEVEHLGGLSVDPLLGVMPNESTNTRFGDDDEPRGV